MANFEPVRTLEELDSLNDQDIRDGYLSTESGDPEPGPNRGKAFWHGWRNRMIDKGLIEKDDACATLARLWVAREKSTSRKEARE
jgi:hypothetical protein